MPRRSDIAILEPIHRSPEEVAVEAAKKSEAMRRESLLADWRKWREIVAAIASGKEPSGSQLGEIAELAARLRLPVGSLADAVRALGREEELEKQLADHRRRLAQADERAVALKAEIEAAELRVRELKAEQQLGQVVALTIADLSRSIAENQSTNPIAFLDVEELVNRSIAFDARSNGKP
jgi:phage shock protein A